MCLREAFSEHHALQCGFCTPGMLMTARDIVTRLPDADERRIRLELSGNLCRCTGYVGIVEAVRSALATAKTSGLAGVLAPRGVGPVGSHRPSKPQDFSRSSPAGKAEATALPAASGSGKFRCDRLEGGRTGWRAIASVVFRPVCAIRGLADFFPISIRSPGACPERA